MAIRLKQDMIYDAIKNDIIAERIPAGSKLMNGQLLAEQFGVSHLTARKAIKRLAREGYVVLLNGCGAFVANRCSMQERKANILILLPEYIEANSPHSCVLPGFERGCYQYPVTLTRMPLEWLRGSDHDTILHNLKSRNYTGILLLAASYIGHECEIELLKDLEIPVLLPFASETDSQITGFSSLHPDWQSAWADGLRHLCSQGYRRIAMLLADFRIPIYSRAEHLRLLEQFSCETDPQLLEYVEYRKPDALYPALEKLCNLRPRPEAIYCASDTYAMRTIQFLEKCNFRIPDDIAVMGFSGMPSAHVICPTLSTVDFEFERIGQQAAELLLDPPSWFSSGQIHDMVTEYRIAARGSAERKSSITGHKP